MRRCRTAVIPRKRISGAAAPHRFLGESEPRREGIATYVATPPLLKASPHRCHAATYLKTPAAVAVVTQISDKEVYFYKSEEYVIFSVNNQYLFDY